MSAYSRESLDSTAQQEAVEHAKRYDIRIIRSSVLWLLDVTNSGATLEVSYKARVPGPVPTTVHSFRIAL